MNIKRPASYLHSKWMTYLQINFGHFKVYVPTKNALKHSGIYFILFYLNFFTVFFYLMKIYFPILISPFLSSGPGSRESGYESGILVSKAVDLNLHQVELKPAGGCSTLTPFFTSRLPTLNNLICFGSLLETILTTQGAFVKLAYVVQHDTITQEVINHPKHLIT